MDIQFSTFKMLYPGSIRNELLYEWNDLFYKGTILQKEL